LRRYLELADARRTQRLRNGELLDEHGMPVGTIPAAFIDDRDEAGLVFPGAREVFRSVQRGTGSLLMAVISFDDVPAARLDAGYLVPALPDQVLDWYQAELGSRGWTARARRYGGQLSEALQGFDRGRQSFIVTVPTEERARRAVESSGVTWPLPSGHSYVEVDYRIPVRRPQER
jgi:hypothetical protein